MEHMEITPVIEIQQGQLRGLILNDYRNGTFCSFKGIPYGKPPLGPLRFKAPLPAEKWLGILDAFKHNKTCYQCNVLNTTQFIGNEDCLYLNVYTKSLPTSKPLLKPVMVFIHGGGFVSGSGNSTFHGPEFLMTSDIVLVTFNYRLGILGFLSFDDPELGVPGNAALKDCLLLLKWIQNNISQFNGDPNNVTIFGVSAGAVLGHLLVLSSHSKGLIHKVIMQSGSALNSWSLGQKFTLEKFQELGANYNNIEELLHHLQTIPVETLYQYQINLQEVQEPNRLCYIAPVIENWSGKEAILTKAPIDIIVSGQYNHVPMIIGHTNREGLLVRPSDWENTKNKIPNIETCIPYDIFNSYQDKYEVKKRFAQHYFGISDPSKVAPEYNDFIDLIGDTSLLFGIWTSIFLHKNNHESSMYVYRMTVESPLNMYKIMKNITHSGACHADDIGYLFKTIVIPNRIKLRGKEDIYIQRFVQMWTNFAKYGDPTPENFLHEQIDVLNQMQWTQFQKDTKNVLDIGTDLKMEFDSEPKNYQFLWQQQQRIQKAKI